MSSVTCAREPTNLFARGDVQAGRNVVLIAHVLTDRLGHDTRAADRDAPCNRGGYLSKPVRPPLGGVERDALAPILVDRVVRVVDVAHLQVYR